MEGLGALHVTDISVEHATLIAGDIYSSIHLSGLFEDLRLVVPEGHIFLGITARSRASRT